MNSIQLLRNKLEQAKGQKIQLEKSLTLLRTEKREKERDLRRHEQAQEVIKTVAKATQDQLSFHISDITSLAMEAVFNEPYQLQVEFVERRNKTECDLYFSRDDNQIDPLSASGGGTVDVAAFALRIASWSMSRPHSRNTILLDEPMRFLSADCQERASLMIKEISQKLGLQFIIITHETMLTSAADKIFEVNIRKGISKVSKFHR